MLCPASRCKSSVVNLHNIQGVVSVVELSRHKGILDLDIGMSAVVQ